MSKKNAQKSRVGQVIHIRLSENVESAMRNESKKMRLKLATYIRIFIEETFERHGAVRYASK